MFSINRTRSEVVKALDFDASEVDSSEVAKEVIISNAILIRRFLCSAGNPYSLMCQNKQKRDFIFYLSACIRSKLSDLIKSIEDYDIETPLEDGIKSLGELKKIQSSLYTLF